MGLLLTIDEGNSSTKYTWWEGDSIIEAPEEPVRCDAVIVSTVDPSSTLAALYRDRADRLIVLSASTPLPFGVRYAATLGPDRIAAAAGAMKLFPGRPVLIADLGTAATYDFVGADGSFMGGDIAPGVAMRLQSLAEHTAALPEVSVDGPAPLLATNTEEAMRSGAVLGVAAEIEYRRARLEAAHPDLVTVITGGSSRLVAQYVSQPFTIEPNLISIGLKSILDHNENL